jgi:hypothetical protein
MGERKDVDVRSYSVTPTTPNPKDVGLRERIVAAINANVVTARTSKGGGARRAADQIISLLPIGEMVEVLEPFADLAAELNDMLADGRRPGPWATPTAGQLRAARALSEKLKSIHSEPEVTG